MSKHPRVMVAFGLASAIFLTLAASGQPWAVGPGVMTFLAALDFMGQR